MDFFHVPAAIKDSFPYIYIFISFFFFKWPEEDLVILLKACLLSRAPLNQTTPKYTLDLNILLHTYLWLHGGLLCMSHSPPRGPQQHIRGHSSFRTFQLLVFLARNNIIGGKPCLTFFKVFVFLTALTKSFPHIDLTK